MEVVDELDASSDRINIGSTVTIKDLEFGDEETYKIVGSTEANSLKGTISNESPVGRELIGKGVGAVIEIEAPGGTIQYEVIGLE